MRHWRFAACLAMAMPCAAMAHHSYGSFDEQHQATLSGTLKVFHWSNPHCWIELQVPDGKGGQTPWLLEGGAVNELVRRGWTMHTLEPGMKVKLLIAPRRDGSTGGSWTTLLAINDVPFTAPAR